MAIDAVASGVEEDAETAADSVIEMARKFYEFASEGKPSARVLKLVKNENA